MAIESRGFFGRRHRADGHRAMRVLTAASERLRIDDRKQAQRMRALRQGWQSDAWSYYDSIPELSYAVSFMANCASRMRIYPSVYPISGESDAPMTLADADAPPEIVALANMAMRDLGNGRLAIAELLNSLSTNLTVAGEGTLLGQEDPVTGVQTWTVRSVDEIVVYDDSYHLREVPNDPQGILGWVKLDPDYTVASRIWKPHPRFRILAQCAMRALIDDCESLMILRRMIRATGRSRLARDGILLMPNEMSIVEDNEDNRDPQADSFMAQLTESMLEPIADEGVASAAVPIVLQGPGELLAQVRLLSMSQNFDAEASKIREELVGVIATGVDLPKEVISGVADLNHWSAWQVDDNTFRHHIEPHVLVLVDCLTSAYLRPYMLAMAPGVVDPSVLNQWLPRMLFWYDPVELVTHPDQTADALQLYDRDAISWAKLREVAGFSDDDAPTIQELQARLISKQRTFPPNLTMEILHQLDPTLIVPPITTAGTIPGIKPSGVDVGTPPPVALPAPAQAPAGPPAATPNATTAPQIGPPAADRPVAKPPVTASAAAMQEFNRLRIAAGVLDPAEARRHRQRAVGRLSEQMTMLDRDLRSRLVVAANAALQRQLERAGARVRSKVAKDETLRTKIALSRNEHVAALLGKDVVTAAGLNPADLMHSDWGDLKDKFYSWVGAAQRAALALAGRITGDTIAEADLAQAQTAQQQALDAAWGLLADSMTKIAHEALYSADPNVASIDLDQLVPTGVIRAACAVAGGYGTQDLALVKTATGAEVPMIPVGVPVGQIGTGSTIGNLITSTGMEPVSRTWVHGPSLHPFEPHEALDGVSFTSWDDEVLANDSGFPDNSYFIPGDHQGCMCDWTVEYADTGQTDQTDQGADAPDMSEADA